MISKEDTTRRKRDHAFRRGRRIGKRGMSYKKRSEKGSCLERKGTSATLGGGVQTRVRKSRKRSRSKRDPIPSNLNVPTLKKKASGWDLKSCKERGKSVSLKKRGQRRSTSAAARGWEQRGGLHLPSGKDNEKRNTGLLLGGNATQGV